MSSTTLPQTMKALICESVGQPLKLVTLPVPTAVHGSVVVKIICTPADPSITRILSGQVGFTFPNNIVPGGRSIGRVAALGPDTTSLAEGQLVLLEPFVRARDNPDVQILWGSFDGPSPASKKFMADNWSQAGYAEYCRAPLENVYPLNEKVLCGSPAEGGLGYSHYDLLDLSKQIVAFGGFRGIKLQPGETVIVAPATGIFSGAAVHVAVAMGAKVIAMSRNMEVLKKLQAQYPPGRVNIVPNTGDVEADTKALKQFGPVDAYLDISPPQAGASTHVRSCFGALKQEGRVSLMGVLMTDLPIVYGIAAWNNITIKGQYMYEREDVRLLIKLAESGVLKLGKAAGGEIVGTFKFDDVQKAFELAATESRLGRSVVFTP